MNEDEINAISSDLIGWWQYVGPNIEERLERDSSESIPVLKMPMSWYTVPRGTEKWIRRNLPVLEAGRAAWEGNPGCPMQVADKYVAEDGDRPTIGCMALMQNTCYLNRASRAYPKVENRDECSVWKKACELMDGP